MNGGRGSPLGSGGEPLAGGACRHREQPEESGAAVGEGCKLAHVASRPASSPSKARKTRGQPRRAEATRSLPWAPRAATAGRPHPVRASQSNRPSARTAHGGAGPRRPSPSTGLGPGRDWNRGVRSEATALPASQRTRPPEASGTTTMPANRSDPRSMKSPESRILAAEKPRDSRACRSPPPPSAGRGRGAAARRTSDAAFRLDEWRPWAQARGCRPAARWPPAGSSSRPAG